MEKTLFKFVVDGEWKVDESFATETDEHGNINNVLTEELLEGYEGDIQEITKDVPGAFPSDIANVSEADVGNVAREGVGNTFGAVYSDKSVSKNVSETGKPVSDLSETDKSISGAVSGLPIASGVDSVASGAVFGASSTIPAASTSSQDVVSHDLQPSHLDPTAQSTLENAIEGKFEAVESGQLEPIAGINRDVVTEETVEKDLAPVAALSAAGVGGVAGSEFADSSIDPISKSADHVTPSKSADHVPSDHVTSATSASSSPKSPNKHAIPVASYGFPENDAETGNSQIGNSAQSAQSAQIGSSQSGNSQSGNFAASNPPSGDFRAAIPAAAAAHALTMHDLQPSALDPDAEATLDHVISTKYSAVESGAISPVDSTGQSRAVPSTPTKGRHDSEYDHVTELRDEYGSGQGSPRSRDNAQARVPPSPGIGSGFDEVKPKERSAESGHVTSAPKDEFGSRFHENETAPPSPNPMSPHLASLAKKEGIPVEGGAPVSGVSGGAPVSEPVSGVSGVSGLAPTSVGSAIPTSTASSLHSAAATKSVAPGTPSSTAVNMNVEAPGVSNTSQGVSGASQDVSTTSQGVSGVSNTSQNSPLASETSQNVSGVSQNVSDASAAPTASATAPTGSVSAPVAPVASAPGAVVAAPASASAHASVASAPATAADVTIKGGASKKDKRRSIFRKIKDKMF